MTGSSPARDTPARSLGLPDVRSSDLLSVLRTLFVSRALARRAVLPDGRRWAFPATADPERDRQVLDVVATCGAAALDGLPTAGGRPPDLLAFSPHLPAPALARGVTLHAWLEAAWGRADTGTAPGPPWGPAPALGLPGPFSTPGIAVQVLAGMTLPPASADSGDSPSPAPVGLVVAHHSALASGALHEGFNLAAVRRSRLVLVLVRTADGASARAPALEDVAEAYGVPCQRSSTRDVPSLLGELGGVVQVARGGNGPTLLEVSSIPAYGDGGGRDPLAGLRDAVVRTRVADSASVAELEEDARREVEAALRRMSVRFRSDPIDAEPPPSRGAE